jgi:hypothetical protein
MRRPILPISEEARAASVGDAWAVVHSFLVGQFYLEELAEAVEKNFRSFAVAAGEDWQVIGIFASLGQAHDAISAWIRSPGAEQAMEGKVL